MTFVKHCKNTLRRLVLEWGYGSGFMFKKPCLAESSSSVRTGYAELCFATYEIKMWAFVVIEIVSFPILA